MATYSFKYWHGQSMPEAHQEADNDDHFFSTVLPAWERSTGFKYVQGTASCSVMTYRKVPEPTPRPNAGLGTPQDILFSPSVPLEA